MRAILSGAWAVVALLASSEANAAKLMAVLPLDVSHAKGKLDADAQDDLEEMLRDVATDALTPSGWTILTGETMLQVLQDNGVDPAGCGEQNCHLSMAREIKADKFLSGNVRFVEGSFSASIRLIDTPTGRILATESIEGDSVKALRTDFKSKAHDFFSKGGMVLASAVDVSQRTPDTSHPSPTVSPSAPAAVTPSPSSVVSSPATETPSATSATTPSAPPTLARSPTVAPPAATEATDAAPPDVVPPQLPAWKGGQRFHHLAVRVGFGGFNGAVGISAEYRFIRYASLSVGGSVSGWTAQEGGNNEWYGFPAPWGGGLAVTAALTGYLPLYFHGSPYASLQFGTAIGGSSGLGLTVGWDWIALSILSIRTGVGVCGGGSSVTVNVCWDSSVGVAFL